MFLTIYLSLPVEKETWISRTRTHVWIQGLQSRFRPVWKQDRCSCWSDPKRLWSPRSHSVINPNISCFHQLNIETENVTFRLTFLSQSVWNKWQAEVIWLIFTQYLHRENKYLHVGSLCVPSAPLACWTNSSWVVVRNGAREVPSVLFAGVWPSRDRLLQETSRAADNSITVMPRVPPTNRKQEHLQSLNKLLYSDTSYWIRSYQQ